MLQFGEWTERFRSRRIELHGSAKVTIPFVDSASALRHDTRRNTEQKFSNCVRVENGFIRNGSVNIHFTSPAHNADHPLLLSRVEVNRKQITFASFRDAVECVFL